MDFVDRPSVTNHTGSRSRAFGGRSGAASPLTSGIAVVAHSIFGLPLVNRRQRSRCTTELRSGQPDLMLQTPAAGPVSATRLRA